MSRELTASSQNAYTQNSVARDVVTDSPLLLVEIYAREFDERPFFAAVPNRRCYKFGESVYLQHPLSYDPPEEGERDYPRLQLSIRYNRDYVRDLLLHATYKGFVVLRTVQESNGDVIWTIRAQIENAAVNRDTITFTLGNSQDYKRALQRVRFNNVTSPGLF